MRTFILFVFFLAMFALLLNLTNWPISAISAFCLGYAAALSTQFR